MLRTGHKWIVAVLLAVSIGTPWTVLQTVAWFSMVVRYSQQAGFSRAVAMTFDGKHPCRLCHIVQREQAKERQQGQKTAAPDETLQLGLPPERFALVHPPLLGPAVAAAAAGMLLFEAPPLPPPRWA